MNIEACLSDLENRLSRVEHDLAIAQSELAVRNVIALYGLAVDCGDVKTALECHTKDAVYTVSNPNAGRGGKSKDLKLKGHKAIKDMLKSDMHQSLLPHCAHTVGPLVVTIEGGKADVTGYSRVYYEDANKPALMRLAMNQWTLVKGDKWQIKTRTSRVMGEAAAQKLLKSALENK